MKRSHLDWTRLSLAILSVLHLSLSIAIAQEKVDFTTHPFFKLLVGEWKSEGSLEGRDGNTVKMKEEWRGSVSTEGCFLMKGSRTLNEDKQEYLWTISFNPSTGLFEAIHEITSTGGETKRFEASVSEVDLTMELLMNGDGSGSIVVKDSFPKKHHNTLASDVILTDSSGMTSLSGTITHERVQPSTSE
jgi:hypothetical protein